HNVKLNRLEISWVTASGKQGKTSVSIKKHGKDKAFEMACQDKKRKRS
ncbi:MAG: AP2 domain-containing protein, partial [Thermodesulfovibrionia bacterium]|nr:AP2 domain-containing protein [Thermodesulfovibrionia bacterium]